MVKKNIMRAHELAEMVATAHQVAKFREILYDNGQRRYEVKQLEDFDYNVSEDDELRGDVPVEMTKWTMLDGFTASAVHQIYQLLMQSANAEENQKKFDTLRFTTLAAFSFRACK